jgi:hypothetical protein
MKVKDLIEALKQFDQELEVYSCCDHGQQPEKSHFPSVIFVDHTDSRLDDGEWTSYEEDAEESGFTKKAVIL